MTRSRKLAEVATSYDNGTANGVAYLNGSKVLATGSALTFDGSKFDSTVDIYARANIYTFATSMISSASAGYPIVFGINGTEQMRLTSTGLGIGTSSPSYQLHVTGATPIIGLTDSDTGSNSYISASSSVGSLSIAANDNAVGSGAAITFRNNGSERMRIDSNGNVGIGTSSPTSKLHVASTTNAAGYFTTSFAGAAALQGVHSDASGTGSYGQTANGVAVYGSATGSGTGLYGVSSTGYIVGGTTGGVTTLNIVSTDASSAGMNVYFNKDSASPANGDSLGLLRFTGNDSTAVVTEYARLTTSAVTVTNGSEQGAIDFRIVNAGTLSTVLVLNSTSDIRAIGAYNSTTASAANVFVGSTGLLSRSTSSGQYKTDVENLDPMRSEAIYQMRPVWYRSLCANDNADWSWYGFIAEEMAAIEPRLVHWGYADDQYDEVVIGKGDQAVTDKVLKADAVMKPEGVQYDRITVFLVEEMQKMKKEMDALKAEIDSLKGV